MRIARPYRIESDETPAGVNIGSGSLPQWSNLVSLPRPYRVLIVDDDPDHVVLVEIVFAHLDANSSVSVTWSAEEAIAGLEENLPFAIEGRGELPDVIVLDINMPGIGGIGFLEWYHERPETAHIPVVVFTSLQDPELEQQCLALGAREFKEKPPDFAELVPVVQRALDRWHPSGSDRLASGDQDRRA
jgi:CheY-like chemotaxis protein